MNKGIPAGLPLKLLYSLCFIIFVITAIFTRFYRITEIPLGFLNDEAALGYNAYSLLKTGKDEFGKRWPIIFESFGEGKPGMMVYHVFPWVAMFGLTEFSVRFSPALFSVLTVMLVYFLTNELFKTSNGSKQMGLLGMLLLILNPWDIIFSRGGAFGQESLFWTTLAVLAYLKWNRNHRLLWLITSGISASLSMLSYHSARVFIPAMFAFLYFSSLVKSKSSVRLKGLAVLACTIGVVWIYMFLSPLAGSRAAGVSVLHPQSGVSLKLNLDITESAGQPLTVVRLMHNKLESYARDVFQRYLSHFSPDFLFFKGDDIPRYQVPNHGLFLSLLAPFMLVGIYLAIKDKKYVLLAWLLCSPLPAALTFQTPSSSRAKYLVIPVIILSAWGIMYTCDLLKSRYRTVLLAVVCLAVIWQGTVFWDAYTVHAQVREPYHWQGGYKELVSKVVALQNQYSQVEVTDKKGTPYIFFLFYTQYDPLAWQRQAQASRGELDMFHFQSMKTLDTISFVSNKCPASYNPNQDTLYVCVNEEIPSQARVLETIRYKNGEPAFVILDLRNK